MVHTIFIATPSFNSADYIDRSILSVVSQLGDFKIRFHVQDGASTDATLQRLQWWVESLASGEYPVQCRGIHMTYSSEADGGMYDGLCRAIKYLDPDPSSFMTWINSDDILMPGACALIAKVATDHGSRDIAWVTGERSVADALGLPKMWQDELPPIEAIKAGLCDGYHLDFIQQEGTFFRGWLWTEATSPHPFANLVSAGDWYLWATFAQHADLYKVNVPLGRFTYREGQISQDLSRYFGEIDGIMPMAERQDSFLRILRSTKQRIHRLAWDEEFNSFLPQSHPLDRFLFASKLTSSNSDLSSHVKDIIGNDHLQYSSRHPFDLMALTRYLIGITEKDSDQLQQYTALISRYQMLSSRAVNALAHNRNLEEESWKRMARRHPLKISKWLALRRYKKRSRQQGLKQ